MPSIINVAKAVIPTFVKDRIKANIPEKYYNREWHRNYVGGMWDEIGQLQFAFLKERGLQQQHYFLDVGCGALRGGVRFINFLDPGHYFGIDRNPEIIGAANRIEIPRHGLSEKHPRLMVTDNFGFDRFGQTFDFALAQSVFTHVPINDLIMCLMKMDKVLKPGGTFFATFWENPGGKLNLEPIMHFSTDGADFPTFLDRDGYHYDVGTFEWICEGTSLKVEFLGDWSHPRDQKMLAFVKQSS